MNSPWSNHRIRTRRATTRHFGLAAACLALLIGGLACSLSVTPRAAEPSAGENGLAQTEQALQSKGTALAAQEATMLAAPSATVAPSATAAPSATLAPTEAPPPTATVQLPTPTETQAAPAEDMEARIQGAKILVYEDTQPIGYWIQKSLDAAGYEYTHTGDALGDFMENLNSGIEWDLIIVGAESKNAVRGEFWDQLADQANRKTAIIAEIWYLDSIAHGRIYSFMTECGISFQKDLPLADSIYWLEPEHPLFNEPNTVLPLLHYGRYWASQAGDLISLRSEGDAELLAGTFTYRPTDYGQIAACMDGRVIFQTFSNHDYAFADIQPLWQNYVYYTLKNHFLALDE